jgi:ketosteroid isomerase-like protein
MANLILILRIASCCLYIHNGIQSDVTQVLNQMKEQESCWNAGDINCFMKHYWNSDSLKFVGKSGITYGWQKTLDNYKKHYPDKAAMGTLTFGIKEATQLSPGAIYVIGKWDLQKEKPVGGYFTLMWRKIEGQWVIVSDHTS